MKNILCTLLFLLAHQAGFGQQPEPVYSYALAKQSPEWYKKQAELWKKETVKNPTNGLAWYYYYYALRNQQMTDPTDQRPDTVKFKERGRLVDEMEKAIPDSYEYHLCKWKEHGQDPKYRHHMNRVYELGANRVEHLDHVINDGEMERDIKKRNNALLKKWEAGLISPGMANYNRNVLAGIPDKSILITAGDNDTYPTWYVQATGYKSDVYVLNMSILMVDSYRDKICKELGIAPIVINWESESKDDPDDVSHFYEKLIPALAKNTKGYELHIGLTTMGFDKLTNGNEDHLYLTGLTYKYNAESLDERALLKRNFEHRYALDYISQSFYHDISSGLVPQINMNYIVPMLKLYAHYRTAGELSRQEWIKSLLLTIAKGTSSEKEVLDLLK